MQNNLLFQNKVVYLHQKRKQILKSNKSLTTVLKV